MLFINGNPLKPPLPTAKLEFSTGLVLARVTASTLFSTQIFIKSNISLLFVFLFNASYGGTFIKIGFLRSLFISTINSFNFFLSISDENKYSIAFVILQK